MQKPSAPPFYNRTPWNLLLGMGLLSAGLIAVAVNTTPWILLVPYFIWVYTALKRHLTRAMALRSNGYFGGFRTEAQWVYEERQGYAVAALVLPLANTEPGRWELFIPDEQNWRATVPAWARERRAQIATRISERWKPSNIHLPDDLPGTTRGR